MTYSIFAMLWIVAIMDLWIVRQALHGKHFMAKFFRFGLGVEAMAAVVLALYVYELKYTALPLLIFLIAHASVQVTTIMFHKHRFNRL